MSTTVPPRLQSYAPLLAACEARLRTVVADGREAVAAPAADTLSAGGKRLRPLLVYCCSAAERRRERQVEAAAAAVELVHMATLVHDDVLDGAELRRGHPTVFHRLGRDAAVGAGDYLFAQAFAELTESGSPEAVSTLARASLRLSQGEIAQGLRAGDLTVTEEDYLQRVQLKTAALFSAACTLGAQLGGARNAAAALAEFGELIGVAFQIFDDILDLAGTPEATGKPRGADLRDGTVTLPMILAMGHEPELAEPIAGAMAGGSAESVCDALAGHAGLEEARGRALDLVARARTIAESGAGGATDAAALTEIADGVVDRYA
jgi:geranylgeranyl pyrophosphate synthase